MTEIVNTQENQIGSIGFIFSYTALMCGAAIALTLLWAYSNSLLNEMSRIQAGEAYIVIALLTVGGMFGTIWFS